MRIVVDARSLAGPGRGVARYLHTTLTALAARYPTDEWLAVVPAEARAVALPGVEVVHDPLPGRLLYGAGALFGRPRLGRRLDRADVCWLPAPAPVAPPADVPYVLSLHDLSWELRPRDFTRYERTWHRVARPPQLARRAAVVVALSEVTRGQALERWSLDPQRVVTVHQGVAPPAARPAGGERVGPFFLYVGALEPRKGVDVLAEAHRRARAAGLEARLVLAGAGRLGPIVDRPGIELAGQVDDVTLAALYGGALALVLPSRLEGFGLPPLEAAWCGVPSILSDLPVFTETLGDAAVFVPPDDPAALAHAMTRLAADPKRRRQLGAAARRAVDRFAAVPAAERLYAVLARAAGMTGSSGPAISSRA